MIEFSNVSKYYGNVVALEDITFEIAEGEFTFLIGPSGSGKSTIIKLLIKEEEPSEGDIFFYDTNINSIKGIKVSQLRREFGVVFQDFKLLPHKNLFENISFALEVSGRKNEDIEKTVNYVLDLIGLLERAEAFPHEISGGEKQKVAIARAIAHNPKVLIADEPTGNLDPDSSWEIIKLLQKINQWGTTVIMATHGSDIVDNLGKRVIKLSKGKISSDNIKGTYADKPLEISQENLDNQKETEKKEEEKQEKKAKKEEIKSEVEEKEFEITFTTKTKVPKVKLDKKQEPRKVEGPEKENNKKDEKETNLKTEKKDKEKDENEKVDKKTKLKKKSRKRKGKDVVDLYKLELPTQVEEKLIKKGFKNIKSLKQKDSIDELDLTKRAKKTIRKSLKRYEKNNNED